MDQEEVPSGARGGLQLFQDVRADGSATPLRLAEEQAAVFTEPNNVDLVRPVPPSPDPAPGLRADVPGRHELSALLLVGGAGKLVEVGHDAL